MKIRCVTAATKAKTMTEHLTQQVAVPAKVRKTRSSRRKSAVAAYYVTRRRMQTKRNRHFRQLTQTTGTGMKRTRHQATSWQKGGSSTWQESASGEEKSQTTPSMSLRIGQRAGHNRRK